MPYKFGEYVSTYVDPQSVAISETLRNRFTENFKANDNLTMAVEQMKAALPFENDMAKKKELEGKINSTLETLSTRGDYENLGFAVHKAAKDFSMGYAPIKENYERYQGALKDLDEKYKKGDINAEDYNMATSYITKGYKGFEMDPTTGKVKEGSMYSSPTIYNDPKLMDKMKERLEILYEKKTGKKSGSAGLDANGVWKVTSGETLVQIPEQDVMDVYNAVIEEPDVRMYLDQRADMKLHMVDKSGNTGKYLDAKMQTNSAAIQQINEAIASGKYSASDKKTLATQIEALTKENQQLTAAKSDPNLATSYLKDQFRSDLLDPVRQYAMKKAGVRERTTENTYENDYSIYLDAHKRKQDALAAIGDTIWEQGDVYANNDISGADTAAKTDYVMKQDMEISRLEGELKRTDLSDNLRAQFTSQRDGAIRERSRVQSQMAEAADRAISMSDLKRAYPQFLDIFKEKMPNATAGQIYVEMKKTFDNPNDQDYKEFQTIYKQKTGKDFGESYGAPIKYKSHAEYKAANGFTLNVAESMHDYSTGPYTDIATVAPSFSGTGAVARVGEINAKFEALDPKINAKYAEIKESRMFNTGRIQTGDDNLDIAVTKAKDAYFKAGRPLAQNESVIIDGKTVSGADLAAGEFKIESTSWDPGYNTFQVKLVGKDGVVKTGLYDGRQIQSAGLIQAMNLPEVRFGAAVMKQNSHVAGAQRVLEKVSINGDEIKVLITSNGDASPYVSFINPDGTPYSKSDGAVPKKYKVDDAAVKEILNSGIVTGL
jgi:hypothetical protein